MNLSRLFHCSVIKVLCILLLFSNFYILPDTQVFVNNFFIFSFKLFCILYFNSSFRLTYLSYPVNNFFTFSWQIKISTFFSTKIQYRYFAQNRCVFFVEFVSFLFPIISSFFCDSILIRPPGSCRPSEIL